MASVQDGIASFEGKLASRTAPGFYIRPEWLWQEPLPKVPGVLRELLAAT